MGIESCCKSAELLEDAGLLLLDGGASFLQKFLSGIEFGEFGPFFCPKFLEVGVVRGSLAHLGVELLNDLLAIQSDLSQNVLLFGLEIGDILLQVDQSGFHVGDRLLQPDEIWVMLVWWGWT